MAVSNENNWLQNPTPLNNLYMIDFISKYMIPK